MSATGLDLRLPDEVAALAREAGELAEAWSRPSAMREDSCLSGFDPEIAVETGLHGWIGMTRPTEYGGGRSPLERFVVRGTHPQRSTDRSLALRRAVGRAC